MKKSRNFHVHAELHLIYFIDKTKWYVSNNYEAALYFTVLLSYNGKTTIWKQEWNLPVEKNHKALSILIKFTTSKYILLSFLKLSGYVQEFSLCLIIHPKFS